MTTDGGGWTLGLVKSSAERTSLVDFGSGVVDVQSLGADPSIASAENIGRAAWLDLNELPFETLRIAAYLEGEQTFVSDDIARSDLRIPFGEDGYYLYDDANGYFWCGGAHAFTDLGTGQIDRPVGAPAGCKNHGGLGSGWDFSESLSGNQGLTACGNDVNGWMHGQWNGYPAGARTYPASGAAQAIWLR